MSTATVEQHADRVTTVRLAPRPIPLGRVVGVELRKMLDTRSGFWLMTSIAITALVATGAVILFAPEEAVTYETFASAIGFPMAVVLPMVAILSVTSEWSQRTGLTTFTLVPHRGRVILAKALAAIVVAVVSMLLAFGIGAVGHLVGTAVTGTEAVWDVGVTEYLLIVLGNVLGLMVGFMLGVLIRSSAGAIVAYFVYALLLPSVFGILAALQEWFRDVRGWVDFDFAQTALFEGLPDAIQWTHLAVSGTLWLLLPLALGLRLVLRSEVK